MFGKFIMKLKKKKSNESMTGYGHCVKCKNPNDSWVWCNQCDRKALVDKFHTWSTGNKDLDLFIQYTQQTATSYSFNDVSASYLEYIPYDRFTDVKFLGRGGFGTVLTATWLDGMRASVTNESEKWVKGRGEPLKVVLKIFNNSVEIDQGFISELKLHYHFYHQRSSTFCGCYGITYDPEIKRHGLILRHFPNGDLRNSLTKTTSKLTWTDKLFQLYKVCDNLKDIHDAGYIHGDIHSGNVLLHRDLGALLTDFGLSRPADAPRSTEKGTFGIIPYMAPELFRGEPCSKESDVYAIGVIMTECASHAPAFCDREHDIGLQLEIYDGLRPEVPPETPECYRELVNRCLLKNPKDRPTADELRSLLEKWWLDLDENGNTPESNQFKVSDQSIKRKPKPRHPRAVYSSRFISYTTRDTSLTITSETNPISRRSEFKSENFSCSIDFIEEEDTS